MTATPFYVLFGETLWISPYAFSVYVALTEKGVSFSVEEVLLTSGAHLRPEYRDASVTGRIPALKIGDFTLAESSAIAEYLEETLPAPGHRRLLPEAPHDRARARQLMAWLRSDLGALRDERSTITMFYRFKLPPLSRAAERDANKLIRVTERVLPASGGTLFGDWCLVDSELAFALHRLLLNGHAVPSAVRNYAEAIWARPSGRGFIEHPRPETVPDSYWKFSGTPKPAPA